MTGRRFYKKRKEKKKYNDTQLKYMKQESKKKENCVEVNLLSPIEKRKKLV